MEKESFVKYPLKIFSRTLLSSDYNSVLCDLTYQYSFYEVHLYINSLNLNIMKDAKLPQRIIFYNTVLNYTNYLLCENSLLTFYDDLYQSTLQINTTHNAIIKGEYYSPDNSNNNSLHGNALLHDKDYDKSSFIFNATSKGIHIANLNIQHLLPKLDEIKYQLTRTNSNKILGLCETFLTENACDNILHIPGYTFERRDRKSNRKGGGLIVFISNQITYTRRLDIESNEIESIWIQVNIQGSKPFLLNFVYRPPDVHQTWIDLYEGQIETANIFKFETHIVGDLNLNCMCR